MGSEREETRDEYLSREEEHYRVTAPVSLALPNPSAFLAHARGLLAKRTYTQPLRLDPDAPSNVLYPSGLFAAAHQRASGADLHVLAVNHLAALCDVVEAADAMLRYHDACGMESGHGAYLRAALAALEVPE